MTAAHPAPFTSSPFTTTEEGKKYRPRALPERDVTWTRCECRRPWAFDDGQLGIRCGYCAHWLSWRPKTTNATTTTVSTHSYYVRLEHLKSYVGRTGDNDDPDDDDLDPQTRRYRLAAVKDLSSTARSLSLVINAPRTAPIVVGVRDGALTFSADAPSGAVRERIEQGFRAQFGADWPLLWSLQTKAAAH